MVNLNSFSRVYFYLAGFATALALFVVMLGAYTRLKDAGLGCPDWPGCYGQATVPQTTAELKLAQHYYPHAIVEPQKAWLEMIHRYFAASLGLLIVLLTVWAMIRKFTVAEQPIVIPLLLCLAVLFQAALGKWTVTMKLLPLVVMGHLLGGMLIAALLWALTLSSGHFFRQQPSILFKLRPWAILGLIILVLQIFLGGWTSANYAALACDHFPLCHGSLFPAMDFKSAFNFFSTVGVNYEGGVLDNLARIAIQMTHRYGAFITAFYLGILAFYLIIAKTARGYRGLGWTLLSVLGLQFCLGVLNVESLLPLPIAIAHNNVAALLLLTMVTLIYRLYVKRTNTIQLN